VGSNAGTRAHSKGSKKKKKTDLHKEKERSIQALMDLHLAVPVDGRSEKRGRGGGGGDKSATRAVPLVTVSTVSEQPTRAPSMLRHPEDRS